MPREKKVLRYCAGIVDYDVTDTTHWAQMQGTVLVRCDHKAKEGGVGLVSQFNAMSVKCLKHTTLHIVVSQFDAMSIKCSKLTALAIVVSQFD